jgi:hypothetical protein
MYIFVTEATSVYRAICLYSTLFNIPTHTSSRFFQLRNSTLSFSTVVDITYYEVYWISYSVKVGYTPYIRII